LTSAVDIIPEAYFDAVAIAADAPASVMPMTVIEAHLYAYLGCILGLFKGQAVGDWGYPFAVTSEGFPFSVQFETARSVVVARGLVDEDGAGMMTARREEVAAEIDSLLTLGSWANRRQWLRAATQCALALPVGSIRHAIGQTPGLAASVRLGQRRLLLQADDIELLYEEYGIVSSVLGAEVKDLLSPAVIWLSARILRTEDAPVD
jgi:hypothetical protein